MNLLRDVHADLTDPSKELDDIITRLSSCLTDGSPTASRISEIGEVMISTLKQLERAKDRALLIPTGFAALDRQIGGIERSELMVLGGRPSMGKTSLAIDIAVNAAERGFKALIVSVETTKEKLGIRMLSRETKINGRKLRLGALEDSDFIQIAHASEKLSALPIAVIDRETGWENIKRQIHHRARARLDLVLLDYLTLLNIPTTKNERRDVAVGRIANEAKQLAVRLNLGFILLSQLSRKTEGRNDPEPEMSDLRDSGDIEQAADIIMFPFRPAVYDESFQPRDKAFLKIAKGRDLGTGKILVRFNEQITSFSDWSD